jgi:hypothetical protein
MILATSARALARLKIWRGASRISGVILSSLRRLLPSRTMRFTTGLSRTSMLRLPWLSRIATSANRSVA